MPTLPFVLDNLSRLAVRGLDFTSEFMSSGLSKRGDEPPKFPQMPAWGAAIIGLTIFSFVIFLVSIQYTLGDVISTLTMIETPTGEVTLTESDEPDNTLDKEQKESLLEQAPTVTVTPIKPITSTIRSTLKHLTAQAGCRSRWRGIVPAMIYSFLASTTFNFLETIIPRGLPLRMMFVSAFSAVPLARLHMAWTHAMISMPSNLKWYQRIAPLSSYKQLWIPTIVSNAAGVYAVYATVAFSFLVSRLGLNDTLSQLRQGEAISGAQIAGAIFTWVGIGAFALFCGLFIVLPAHVTLVRVEASMLPEDEDTIVPFDRTFNGKVVPKVVGGTGAVGFVDAWKTFNWEARRRLIKLYVKNVVIQLVTIFTFLHLVAFESIAIMGKPLRHYICQMRQWQKAHPDQVPAGLAAN